MPKVYHYSPEEMPGGAIYDYMITIYKPPWLHRVLARIFPSFRLKMVPLSKLLEEIQLARRYQAEQARRDLMVQMSEKAGIPAMEIDTKKTRDG